MTLNPYESPRTPPEPVENQLIKVQPQKGWPTWAVILAVMILFLVILPAWRSLQVPRHKNLNPPNEIKQPKP